MSLWCGACRTEIFEGFGLLYRMPMVDGAPRPPTKDGEFVPPNSAVCDCCWSTVPEDERLSQVAQAIEPDAPYVFAYAAADSGTSPTWGSKQWSSIEASNRYVYLRVKTVKRFLPKVVLIIVQDAVEKAVVAEQYAP